MSSIASIEGQSLTHLDWAVVAIARAERRCSAEPEGRITRFVMRFFGLPMAPALASERLETLRRFCVRAWHGDPICAQDMHALVEAGYAQSDATRILIHIADCRGFAPAIAQQPM